MIPLALTVIKGEALLVWKKYNWAICLLLLIYSGYKTFVPTKPTVTTTTSYVIDTATVATLTKKIDAQTVTMQQMKKEFSKQQVAKKYEVLRDKDGNPMFDKDGNPRMVLVSDTSSTTTGSSSGTTISSTTTSGTDTSISSTTTHGSGTTTTVINPLRKWSVGGGYMTDKTILLQAGYNLGYNWTIGAVGIYGMNTTDKQAGVFSLWRF